MTGSADGTQVAYNLLPLFKADPTAWDLVA